MITNTEITKLKNEIREQTDNESITYFNETSENLFEEYMLDYKPSIKFPVLEIPNNNNKIIEKPVQPVQPVQPVLVSGGSRKKSKKSRS